jgi:hypothetical protein
MNSFISNFKKQYKKVFFELLGFILLLFLFDRLLFLLIRKGESSFYKSISTYSLNDKFAQINKKNDYKILIFGTSRTYEGIHPWYIHNQLGIKAFKEAFVGKGAMYNYYFYQEYKKNMGIPLLVIYGVDYFIFNQISERHWMQRFNMDVINAQYFRKGVFMLLANKAYIDDFCNTFLNNLQQNIWGDRKFLIEQDNALMENYLGEASAGDMDTKVPPSYKRVGFFRYPGKEGVYFSRLLEELHNDHVTVLLISLPDYIGTYWTNKFHRLYQRTFRNYQYKYNNIHFIDYNQMHVFDLTKAEYFINGGYGKTNSHLSRAGSEIVNRILLKDLRKYLPENEIQKRQ